MKQKNKFLTFLLSFLPGLSHFYVGYADRGIIYLILISVILIFSISLAFFFGDDAPLLIFLLAYPVIWLISLIDVFSVVNKQSTDIQSPKLMEGEENMEPTNLLNKKMITLALSIVPGAGHMYLGLQKRGLIFMSAFFFTIFFMGWLRLSFLTFLLPIIWFYVFFDAFHLVNDKETKDLEKDFEIINLLPRISNSLIGKILIGIGIILIFNNIFYPIIVEYFRLGYRFINYIQTSIVALIFIYLGIKMLRTKKEILRGEDDES